MNELFENPGESTTEDLIRALRDVPTECDFCGNKTEPGKLIPQSGGQWACEECWDRNEERDRRRESMNGPT